MCYLVAKDRDAHGCFALKMTHGKHLVELKRELNKAVGYKGIQQRMANTHRITLWIQSKSFRLL